MNKCKIDHSADIRSQFCSNFVENGHFIIKVGIVSSKKLLTLGSTDL